MLKSGYNQRKQQTCLLKLRSIYQILVFMMGVFCGILAFSLMKTLFAMGKDNFTGLRFAGKTGLDMDDLDVLRQEHGENEEYHKGESVIAEQLSSSVQVLCLVMVTEEKHSKQLEAIKNTWGKRCNTLLFIGSFNDSAVPVLNVHTGVGKSHPWTLFMSAMKYVYIHHMNTHDWVITIEDDTFVIVENLRYLLSNYSSSEALYLGCRFKKHVKQGFMSGGAGVVLSREAVSRMVKDGLAKEICITQSTNVNAFDVKLGLCMEKLGVPAVDTRDDLGRGRFFPFPPKSHLIPGEIKNNSWYWDMAYYPDNTGFNCCSDTAITFHEMDPEKMYTMNYLVYHLRPFGVNPHFPPITLPSINKTS